MNCITSLFTCGCFSNTPVDRTCIEIDELLRELRDFKNVSNPKQMRLEKDYKKQQLEKAYQIAIDHLWGCSKTSPDKMLAFRLGEIIKEYGRLCYEENFQTSLVVLQAALNFQLYAIGMLKHSIDLRDFETLEELKMQASVRSDLFQFMDNLILDCDHASCLEHMYNKKYSRQFIHQKMYLMASTLRWMGHCCQNIDFYKKGTPQNDKRFEQIYYLSEALLLPCNDEESINERAELYYNAWQYLHLRKHPGDYDGAAATYEKALELNRSPEMRARVANMRSIFMHSAQKYELAKQYQKEAMEIRTSLPENEQNGFLYANLRNNYASFLLNQPEPDYAEAEKYLMMALRYSTASRDHQEDHHYFAFYDFNMARVKMASNEFDAAESFVQKAIETLKKHPECNEQDMKKANELLAEIAAKRNAV